MAWTRGTPLLAASCIIAAATAGCGSAPPLQLPAADGLVAGWSIGECLRPGDDGDDADRDGLDDACELALARTFAPLLVVRSGGCNHDETASPARPGGGYFFGVRPLSDDGAVRVVYLPAYFRDCGWSGPKCLLPWVSCDPHAGDSEFLVVDLMPMGERRWRTDAVFLSAHCFGRSGGDCRWYRDEELGAFEWVDGRVAGAPVVWVAEGRNANYPSRRACDRGHHRVDRCDRNEARYRFPVAAEGRNIGSRLRPMDGTGCVSGSRLDHAGALIAPDAVECFWSDEARFRGWTAEGVGVTPYSRYLREIAGFE